MAWLGGRGGRYRPGGAATRPTGDGRQPEAPGRLRTGVAAGRGVWAGGRPTAAARRALAVRPGRTPVEGRRRRRAGEHRDRRRPAPGDGLAGSDAELPARGRARVVGGSGRPARGAVSDVPDGGGSG